MEGGYPLCELVKGMCEVVVVEKRMNVWIFELASPKFLGTCIYSTRMIFHSRGWL